MIKAAELVLAGSATVRWALRQNDLDQQFLVELTHGNYHLQPPVQALARVDLHVAFLMRVASRGGPHGRIARRALLRRAIDVSPGAVFEGAIYLPHPLGIVIGEGVHVGSEATIYQHVTIGQDRHGQYPIIGKRVVLFTGCTVYGGVHLGDGTLVGAGLVLQRSTDHGEVIQSQKAPKAITKDTE